MFPLFGDGVGVTVFAGRARPRARGENARSVGNPGPLGRLVGVYSAGRRRGFRELRPRGRGVRAAVPESPHADLGNVFAGTAILRQDPPAPAAGSRHARSGPSPDAERTADMTLGIYFTPSPFTPEKYDEVISRLEGAGAGARRPEGCITSLSKPAARSRCSTSGTPRSRSRPSGQH